MGQSNAKKIREIKKHIFVYALIIVQLVNFAIFYIYVNFNSIMMAFQLKMPDGVIFTMENFTQMFNEFASSASELWMSLKNTLIFFVFGFVMLPISLVCSYFIYKKIWAFKFYRIVFFIPSILSAVVWSNIYRELIGPEGPVAIIFQQLMGLDMAPTFLIDSRYALTAVIMYGFWLGIAGNFVLFCGTLARIPDSVIEAGKLDGVGWFRELVQVVIPLIWPTLSTMVIISLTGIFTASGNILLLTGGTYGTNTISFYIFQRVYGNAETSNSYNYAAAVGLFFTILTLPMVLLANKLLSKVESVEY